MRNRGVLFALASLALCAGAAHAQDSSIDIEQAFTAHPERFGEQSVLEQQLVAAIEADASAGVEAATSIAVAPEHPDAEAQGEGERETWGDKNKEAYDSALR